MAERIKIDVSGQVYAIPTVFIENGPPSRLTQMYKVESQISDSDCITVNRPTASFAAILALYQTGELHIPMTSCPAAFLNELEFWEIPIEWISDCCYNRLQTFLDEQATLEQFKQNLADEKTLSELSPTTGCVRRLRATVWEIVDYTKPSFSAKIYFVLMLFMVLLSIFTLSYSTDASFIRTMTNCERLEYMIDSGMKGYELIKTQFEEFCDDENLPNNSIIEPPKPNPESDHEENEFIYYWHMTETHYDINYDTLDANSADINGAIADNSTDNNDVVDDNTGDDRYGDLLSDNDTWLDDYALFENSTLTLNVTPPIERTPLVNSSLEKIPLLLLDLVKVPNLKVKLFILVILDAVTAVYFTVDIILRLCSCPRFKYYFMSIINITDAIALVATYIYMTMPVIYITLRYGNSWIDILGYIQMLRSLRLFRIITNIRAGKVLAYSLRRNVKDLSIIILFLITGMCTFASCFYMTENKHTVRSIPHGWYWAIITMTTVGYGDIGPQTGFGRLIACLCAVSGVLLLAFTVPIFANHFQILYQHADTANAIKKFQNRNMRTQRASGRIKDTFRDVGRFQK